MTPELLDEANEALRDAQWAERQGLLEKAVDAYRKVVRLCPTVFQVHSNLANLLLGLDRPAEALAAAQAAFAIKPLDPLVNANLGRTLASCGEPEQAIPCLQLALAHQPGAHVLRNALANALLDTGKLEEAVAIFDEVRDRAEGDAPLLQMMAAFYYRAKCGAAAEWCYLKLIDLAPTRSATYNDLAQLYVGFAHFGKARKACLKGLEFEPNVPVLWNTLANSQASLGMIVEALESYRRVLSLAPDLAAAHSNMLLSMHYSSEIDPKEIIEEHRRWARLHAPAEVAQSCFSNQPDPMRRIRVGYLSPDIRSHSVAFFLEPLLDHRDRGQFEVFCYAMVKTPDDVTTRLRGKFDRYRNLVRCNNRQIAEAIRSDEVDILVDLAGHAGTVHAAALAYKPAPVQVTYCGYPNTTGMVTVDYRLTDKLSDPPGVDDEYVERLVRIPAGFLCYLPPADPPDVGETPGLQRGYPTFGSFNREFKVSQKTFDLWCEILRQAPEARLQMKSVAGADAEARAYQLSQFESRGIDPGRIELVGFLSNQRDHLATYRNVDIALDTFPYHGTTTTLDSILMGVPVLTLAGHNHASRVGVSLLTQLGLEDFVARNDNDYIGKAIGLGSDLNKVNALHGVLRNRLLSSSICDGRGFTRKFELALRGMWYNWCRSQGSALTAAQCSLANFEFDNSIQPGTPSQPGQ